MDNGTAMKKKVAKGEGDSTGAKKKVPQKVNMKAAEAVNPVETPDKETQGQYRQRVIDMVCEVTTASDKGMDRICKAFQNDDSTFPDETTIRCWFTRDEKGKEFRKQYARAKEEQVEKLVDQIIDISDDGSLDIAFTEDGKPFVDQQHIQRSKLRVDSRKWIASKLLPKKYGDKITQEQTGPNGGPIEIAVSERPQLSREEWLKIHGIAGCGEVSK